MTTTLFFNCRRSEDIRSRKRSYVVTQCCVGGVEVSD